MIRTIELQTITFPLNGAYYVWTHLGEGELAKLETYNHHTGWIGTSSGRFLVTPQETLYKFDTEAERESCLQLFRSRLKEQREKSKAGVI